MNDETRQAIDSPADLREFMGAPMDLAVAKAIDHIDEHCQAFIERSPFLCMGTADSDGRCDVSPRGDLSGFVQVLDPHTLFIPERPGNKRIDSMSNIAANPEVGLLFLVPGFEDCLRINGRATLVRDEELLEKATVKGKKPRIGILVTVREAYLHCAKAIRRAQLWDASKHQDRSELPSLGRMILEQTAAAGAGPNAETVREVDHFIEENYRTELY